MKHNGERQENARRPEDILAEIDRTRHEMDSTLSAIEHRLTPGQLVDQGMDYLRHSGANEFVQNLGSQVKYNPLPVSLVGIGLAWLMAASKRQPDYGSEYGSSSSGRLGERAGEMKDRFGERAGEMKDKVSHGVQSMRERASGTAQSAGAKFGEMRERATAATQSAKERMASMGSGARHQMERARSSADYMMREQPLALGAIGLAVGAFFAAMAPRTHKEDELMGEASDRLADQAKQIGTEKLEQAKEVGKEKLEQAKPAQSAAGKGGDSQPAGKPTVRVQPGDVRTQAAGTQAVPPPVGADLTPRGSGGARGKP
jgi:ElaB/YqjD/DUF883 family membrane-anchored ribosome-binding protein